ncbi:hypothetical protein [Mucilaginibacter sp.]|uniref:hypothetical protein n=1 Tax=Mucilaginibacter sp. TaxID=1882438 RepID=UPI0035BBA322
MNTANTEIFVIANQVHSDGRIIADLKVNGDHPILSGHFPGQPVVPGACMLALVKNVLGDALATGIRLKLTSNVKFMQMIIPDSAELLKLTIQHKVAEAGLVNVTASIINGETACFKLQAVFEEI